MRTADHVTSYLAFCPRSTISTVEAYYRTYPKNDFVLWKTPHGSVVAYSIDREWFLRDKRRGKFFSGTKKEMMEQLSYEITLLFATRK